MFQGQHCFLLIKVNYAAGIYMFKVNNGNTETMCEIFSALTITVQNDVTNATVVFEQVHFGWVKGERVTGVNNFLWNNFLIDF